MLLIAGVVMLALGLFSGAVLAMAPVGWVNLTPGLALWVLFPLFTVLGYALFVVRARLSAIHHLTRVAGAALLLLALLAATVLVLLAASVLHADGGIASVWYVLLVAGVVGAIGSASSAPPVAASN